jgi:hypothetical protein
LIIGTGVGAGGLVSERRGPGIAVARRSGRPHAHWPQPRGRPRALPQCGDVRVQAPGARLNATTARVL